MIKKPCFLTFFPTYFIIPVEKNTLFHANHHWCIWFSGPSQYPEELQQVSMPVWSHELCKETHDVVIKRGETVVFENVKISDGMLCAGEMAGGVDTCGVSIMSIICNAQGTLVRSCLI